MSWPMVMRGVMMEVGGVMGVMAGDGPSDSSTSLSGLSSETSSVASAGGKAGRAVSSPVVLQDGRLVASKTGFHSQPGPTRYEGGIALTSEQVVRVVIQQRRLFGPVGLGAGDSSRNVGRAGLSGNDNNNKASN